MTTNNPNTVSEASQRLQDHMEQMHGITLKKSEWDAAIQAALAAMPEGEPVGWAWEQDGYAFGWLTQLSPSKPNTESPTIRNIRPLYTAEALPSGGSVGLKPREEECNFKYRHELWSIEKGTCLAVSYSDIAAHPFNAYNGPVVG